MKKYLVADGGGTKTAAAVFDENGIILGRGCSGSGNATLSDAASAVNNVLDAAEQALSQAKLSANDIEIAELYVPGFSHCLESFAEKSGLKARIVNEEEEIKYANLPGKDKIIVLSGTGSFASAYVGENTYSVGGWGHIFGDGGSGFDIGRLALEKCAENYDEGRCPKLTERICKELEVADFAAVRKAVYHNANPRRLVASLCVCVCELANEGDDDSIEIVRAAANKLVGLALSAYKKSGVSGTMPTTLTGGVASSPVVRERFASEITRLSDGRLAYFEHNPDIIRGAILSTLSRNKQ